MSGASIETTLELWASSLRDIKTRIHVRPISGQPYPSAMDVECSRGMRSAYPIGTGFQIYAKEKRKEGGKPFLYSHYDWPYEVVPEP